LSENIAARQAVEELLVGIREFLTRLSSVLVSTELIL
jgi:hypothetical protein